MKLLFLIESMTAQSGGPAKVVAELTRLLLLDKKLDITIASTTPRNYSLPIHHRIKFFQFQDPDFLSLSWFKAIKQLRKLIVDHDILFSSGIWGPIDGFALRLAWQQDKKVYLRVCGMLEPYILSRNSLKKQIGLMLYLKRNLQKASGIIVNSTSEAVNVVKMGVDTEKILIIPNGVETSSRLTKKDVARRILGIPQDRPVLLYLSRVHPKKGLHFLLEAIATLPLQKRNFTLLVAGDFSDPGYESDIHNMVGILNLKDLIYFSGLVTGNEKKCHFDAADCFILPSQSEGLPNAVLEALANGLPSIITEGCNIPEVAEYNAGKVIKYSIDEMANSVLWFLNSYSELKTYSDNALTLVREKFNWLNSVAQYEQLIHPGRKEFTA